MNSTGRHGGSPDDIRPPRRAAASRRLGWRAANRIVNGQDGGQGTEDLRMLIAIASAPLPSDGAHAESAARDAVLTAFRETAAAPQPTGRRAARAAVSARTRRASGALVLRFTAAIAIVCGVGAAAASAGVLPPGMQRIAHDYFGVGSAPARSTHAPSTVASGAPSGGVSRPAIRPPTASGVPTSADAVVALCQQVAASHGDNWQDTLDAADQATLIAAAGGKHEVKSYCAELLVSPSPSQSAGPSPSQSAAPSPSATDATGAPSATPTVTHGNAHVSRSPAARSTGH